MIRIACAPSHLSIGLRCGLFAAAMLLAACGGAAEEVQDDPAAANPGGPLQSTLAVSRADASAVTAPAASWLLCASEGQTCSFAGQRDVRYGTSATHATLTLVGGTACSNAIFGDPLRGTVKQCWYSNGSVDMNGWTACAVEGGICSFTGTRTVLYGIPSQNSTRVLAASTPCSNPVFGDPVYGTVKSCWYSDQTVASSVPPVPPAPVAPGPSGSNYPIILNASGSAQAGDVVGLQGENFGSAPTVVLEGADDVPLQIVNRVAGHWVAVQIPSTARGALFLRMSNATGTSARVSLNAARPLHLDTLRLAPGGAFRLFGRNLMVAGATPKVSVDGLPAVIDIAHSDAWMLTLTAPAGLQPTSASIVQADNGNGSGPATLDRTIAVGGTPGAADPFSLGVGWGADFAALTANTVDAASDYRLSVKMSCDGQHDDSPVVQAAIDLAASGGGGVVRLPAGNCRMAGGMNLRSNVVVQGAGKALTVLSYESNYPFFGIDLDLAGVKDLTLVNQGTATEGPLLKDSRRVFLQGVRVRLMTSRQMYLTGNQQFVVAHCDFEQAGSISNQGPYLLNDSGGLVFEGNTTLWVDGAPAFIRVHDSYLHANRFSRDGRAQNSGGTVHSMVIDFAHRIAVVDNSFDVAYGPITNTSRNDGETILTEGGGNGRTENIGTVVTAGSNTLTDPSTALQVDPFATGSIPENYGVAIVSGKGAGQTRRLTAYAQPTMTVDRAWDVVPDATSHYATFVWGLEKSLIKGNTLSQNPRGIWLYQTAIRDVDVIGNTIAEGGGIFLRSNQDLANKRFTPQYTVLISGNRVTNTTGRWMSYLNSVFVNADARDFGVATIGVEFRNNQLTANRPNVSSSLEDYANIEGYMNLMRVENYSGYETPMLPHLLGTLLTGNLCANCDVAVRIGTGSGGATILNTQLGNSAALTADWATTSTPLKSTDTVIR